MADPPKPRRPLRMIAFMKYGARAASTRQRLLQYLPAFADAGITVDWYPLIPDEQIGKAGRLGSLPSLTVAYLRRTGLLARARDYDLIWVHKELFPYMPGWFEASVARLGPPIIYDFDDAIFHNYDLNKRAWVRRALGERFEPLLRHATAASCGNSYLQAYAMRFCANSVIVPTTLDTDLYQPAASRRENDLPVIGWIGSPSTWPYMEPLAPLLDTFVTAGRAQVRIVGAGPAARRHARFAHVDWTESSEIADVQAMDIGIMPLTDDPWSRGKCGYKLIQYMACGLPVVASPVGVNNEIVDHGANGFLATGEDGWRAALDKLLSDAALRREMGAQGRRIAVERYSLKSEARRLVQLARDAAVQTSRTPISIG